MILCLELRCIINSNLCTVNSKRKIERKGRENPFLNPRHFWSCLLLLYSIGCYLEDWFVFLNHQASFPTGPFVPPPPPVSPQRNPSWGDGLGKSPWSREALARSSNHVAPRPTVRQLWGFGPQLPFRKVQEFIFSRVPSRGHIL